MKAGTSTSAFFPASKHLPSAPIDSCEVGEVGSLKLICLPVDPSPERCETVSPIPFDSRNCRNVLLQTMKIRSHIKTRSAVLALLVCSIGYRATAQSQYTITDLGTLPG